ncbi:MAG TPA: DUF4406 domain-containing protein [Candidatus Eisenbacteria bacterium]|nr:DUF4406 domain-containing protein [Candidatus Eisenbacteria bacterium]
MPPRLIAVAGPYSAPTEEGRRRNLAAMHDAAAAVRRLGHVPVIGMDVALPVVDRLHPEESPERYAAIMEISLAVVSRCDALLLIAESPGANRERDLIASLGRPVYRSVEEIEAIGKAE